MVVRGRFAWVWVDVGEYTLLSVLLSGLIWTFRLRLNEASRSRRQAVEVTSCGRGGQRKREAALTPVKSRTVGPMACSQAFNKAGRTRSVLHLGHARSSIQANHCVRTSAPIPANANRSAYLIHSASARTIRQLATYLPKLAPNAPDSQSPPLRGERTRGILRSARGRGCKRAVRRGPCELQGSAASSVWRARDALGRSVGSHRSGEQGRGDRDDSNACKNTNQLLTSASEPPSTHRSAPNPSPSAGPTPPLPPC